MLLLMKMMMMTPMATAISQPSILQFFCSTVAFFSATVSQSSSSLTDSIPPPASVASLHCASYGYAQHHSASDYLVAYCGSCCGTGIDYPCTVCDSAEVGAGIRREPIACHLVEGAGGRQVSCCRLV